MDRLVAKCAGLCEAGRTGEYVERVTIAQVNGLAVWAPADAELPRVFANGQRERSLQKVV